MHPLIQGKLVEMADLYVRYRVGRLALFGSATSEHFDPATSDVDVLVEFEPMPPVQHAASYFGLMEELQQLLGLPVDPVEPGLVRNPYLRQVIAHNLVVLYEAA
jgi:predicted nucleotidyltransferase